MFTVDRCRACLLLDGSVLRAAQNRGGVGEQQNRPGDAAGRRAALPGRSRGGLSVRVFLPAEGVDPAGAVSGGEGGQSQRGQTHVLP